MSVHLPLLWLHPVITRSLAVAGDLEARGLLRGAAKLVLGIVVVLVLLGVLLGISLSRLFRRRR